MRNMVHVLTIMFTLYGAVGCSDNDSDSNNKNPAQPDITTYQLFPAGYFSTGFREEYTVNGTSPAGLVLQGTHLELTQQPKTFNGQQVIPILDQNDWLDTQSGDAFSTAVLSNYATDPDNPRLIGTEDLITAITTLFANPAPLPTSAQIGDSGTLSRDTDSNGNTITRTWSLVADTGDFAKITWATTVSDNAGNIVLEGNNAYVIDAAGNRQSMTILFDLKLLNDPVSWIGTKR